MAPKNSVNDAHGRQASKPSEITWRGWWEIGRRVQRNVARHNLSLIAAGVALFSMLAIFPALNVAVSLYALFSSPADILTQLEPLRSLLPGEAFDIIRVQLTDLSGRSGTTLNITLAVSLVVGVWVSRKGASALITACNIVYNETEQRSFWRLMGLSLLFTVFGVLGVVALGLLAILLPVVLSMLPLGSEVETLLRVLRWPLLALVFVLVLACVYRSAPCRANAKWRWVSVGAVVATVLWIAASVGFTVYVQNFANYNETYGAIGGVIILILWFYLSAFVVLLGAEINAEAEHQTVADSTVGDEKPMGQRGAYVADTLGTEPSDEQHP